MATPEEIFQEHLHYEIDMLLATFVWLQTPLSDTVLVNALIESFCIHARNLDDFFLGRRGAKAQTYATSTYVPYAAGRISSALDKKLNTQIAHLTDARTSDPAQKIGPKDRFDLVATLLAEVHNFAKNLQTKYQPLSRLAAYPAPPTITVPTGPTGPSSTNAVTVVSSNPSGS
jgi:hypothetical protein